MNEHHDPKSHESLSRVDAPCLFHGTLGVCVGVLLELVGLFRKGDDRLMGALMDSVFQGKMPEVLSLPWLVGVAAVFCYALAFVVLDTPGTWRRVVIGITVLVLVLAMVPTLAVWNVYFSPFLPVVAVFWSWFGGMMYVSHHHMPCDVLSVHHPLPHAEVSYKSGVSELLAESEKVESELVEKKNVEDVNQKYQPKDEKGDGRG
jgi:hypothetical protein